MITPELVNDGGRTLVKVTVHPPADEGGAPASALMSISEWEDLVAYVRELRTAAGG